MDGVRNVDIDRLSQGSKGRKFQNAVLSLGDCMIWRTKRGRVAARIPSDKFEPALARWGVTLSPSYDGLHELLPPGAAPLTIDE